MGLFEFDFSPAQHRRDGPGFRVVFANQMTYVIGDKLIAAWVGANVLWAIKRRLAKRPSVSLVTFTALSGDVGAYAVR